MEIHTQNDDIAGSNSHSVPVSSDAWSELPEDLRREAEGVSKSRRDFMKVTGMAAMGAVIAGCTAEDRIVKPLTQKPEGITPGVAYNYASTCQGCSANCGILMKVRDGRPVKLEGNDTNPLNAKTLGGPDKNKGKRPDNGGLCAVGQAQMWTLYNPERLHNPTNKGEAAKW